MKKGIIMPRSKSNFDRVQTIEYRLRMIFRKPEISLLDISTARVLITEYKELTDFDKQKKFRLLAKI